MVTPALALAYCLLVQVAHEPPARFVPPAAGVAQPSSGRRPRAAQPPVFIDEQLPTTASEPADAGAPAEADQPPASRVSVEPPEGFSDPGAGEVSAAENQPPVAASTETPPLPLAPGSPGAVLAEGMAIRAQLETSGAPVRLLDVLGRARDPRVRQAAIDAYWHVSLAWLAAQWRWSDHDAVERMEAMSPAASNEAEQQARLAKFRARLAATEADWRQAEVELAEAQQSLASMLRLSPQDPLPLASDLPHVGAYRTRFETLYAGHPAPERSLAIHRTLPLRERELRNRATAVAAAHEAVEAAEMGLQEGTVALETVFSCLDDQARERQAFLHVVRKYNADIAEYALATPVPAADDSILAARLIKLRRDDGWRWEQRDPAQPSASNAQGGRPIAVRPSAADSYERQAGHVEPRVIQGAAPAVTTGEL